MQRFIIILLLFFSFTLESQTINLKTYQKSSGDNGFTAALAAIKKDYSSQKKHVTLFIPAGIYTLTEPIVLNKYISLEGEFINSTILQVKNLNQEAIILEENKKETEIYNGYNTVKNLTITGPDFNKNPFEWKDLKRNNPRSVGIKINGLRNRIENCTIDGFLWSGIEMSGSYYNFIAHNFIKNNRLGIMIDNTSTSAFVNNNEIRNNGSGILIQNNSYANFINNNVLENNIANMLEPAKSDNDNNAVTKGNGIIIDNAMNNFVQNNYFEQHYNNVYLHNANDNEISLNFFALANVDNTDQNVLKLDGKSDRNTFINNQTMGATTKIDALKINISALNNYSTNKIDFGSEKNEQIKINLRNNRNQKQLPQIP